MINLDNTICFLSAIKEYVPQSVGYQEDKQTHASICTLAANWLIRNHKCRALLIERGGAGGEMPDVIGFYFSDSFVVEVKTSRADFLADSKKPHRTGDGMGMYRYFACPKDMIAVDEVPEGWGLLYVTAKGIIQRKKEAPERLNRDKDGEFVMLTSALASPWKLFQHWGDKTIERLARLNWLSPTLGMDMKLFCGRMAINRLEQNEKTDVQKAKEALFALHDNPSVDAKHFNALRSIVEFCDGAA